MKILCTLTSLTVIALFSFACGNSTIDSNAQDALGIDYALEKVAGETSSGGTQATCVDGVGTNLPEDYDWETDNSPEPTCTFESMADCNDNDKLEKSEAELLRACYQKLVKNCFDIHEAVREQVSVPEEISASFNQLVVKKFWAEEKLFIRACLADDITSKCGN